MINPNKKFKIKSTISTVLILLISSVIIVTLSLQYYFSKDLAFNATENSFKLTAEKIEQKIISLDNANKNLMKTLEHSNAILNFPKYNLNKKSLKFLAIVLENKPYAYAVYAGKSNGDFYELINLNINEKLRKRYNASKNARWLVVNSYKDKTDNIRYTYERLMDDKFKILNTTKKIATYDPSIRPWFKKAFTSNHKVIKTNPYQYTNMDQIGITYAKKIKNGDIVVGLDVSLKSLSNFLKKQTDTQEKKIILFNQDSEIIASANFDKKSKIIPIKELLNITKNDRIEKLNFNLHLDKKFYVYYSSIKSDFKDKEHLYIITPVDTIMKPFLEKIYYSFLITMLVLTLTIPLIMYITNTLVKPIKKLEDENEKIMKRDYDEVKLIDTKIQEYYDLSKSLYQMSISIKDFEQKQDELMDSFIQLIANAIDTKSKYTGGHCERVPLLTIALTEAASKSNDGIFKDFNLRTRDEKRELSIAAWLHDCGKVTTPEYVVDKSTKLETIYNRIHEIRTRFEVIHRDLIIKMYENISNGFNEKEEKEKLLQEHKKLQDEFKIIAQANIGGEFMEDKDIEEIHKISKRKWTKYFNDTIGLSYDEQSRINDKNRNFPREVNLLSDKSDHIIKRDYSEEKDFNTYGFKVDIPNNLYNQGEIYNLTIRKGTLTNEERYKINEHMIMTIKMLEQLPFPSNLKKVPEYAGAHHETLIGTGYPRKLKKEDMSIPARIMAVADVFEALTAADRPYKEAKKISESIEILSFMVKNKHIDEDIFKLFLTSGVFMNYANKYLKKEQIDEVDINKYL